MPREQRKSSLGTRRGPPRQHIPFRADDLERGKKTGIAVQYVDRNSDEFEPFAEVMKQADNRTPPRIKSKKKRIVVVSPVLDEFDEDGEMSMDLAESNQGSPLAYFTNASHLYQSTNTRRPSSLRPPPRSSIVDYDQLPSPRRLPDTFSTRKSLTNGAGPSPPAKPYTAPDPEPDLDPPDSQSYPDDPQVQVEDDPDYGRISDESEEVAEVAEEVTAIPRRSIKGKQRAVPDEVQEPDGVEDDIARGLEGVENDANGTEVEVPQRKRVREEGQRPQRPRGRPAKRVAIAPPERSPTPEGVRRGRRHRYKPLEWWRQERVVYGRRESGLTLVPQIKEIIRVPKEPPKPLGKAGKRGRAGSVRAKTRELKTPVPNNPEEGWDEKTPADGVVLDFLTREPVKRRIIQTARMFEPRSAANSNWFFQKIFGEGDFIAAGEMRIPPRGEKPSKSSKDNAYVSRCPYHNIDASISWFARCSTSLRVQSPLPSMSLRTSFLVVACFSFLEETRIVSIIFANETPSYSSRRHDTLAKRKLLRNALLNQYRQPRTGEDIPRLQRTGLGCRRARGEPKADISIAQQLYGESCTGPGTTLLPKVNEAGCVATCTLVNIVLFTHLWFAAASQGHSGLFFQVASSQPPYTVSIHKHKIPYFDTLLAYW